MSVRRLAAPEEQPAAFAFSNDNAAWADATIRKYPVGRQQSAVIPLLMRAQEQDGWVTRAAIEAIAKMLDMPFIRVLEVATFYTQFQLKPVGSRAHVQVCGTTPCALRGAGDLMAVCRSKIHHEQFHLNASGTLSWEEVECLGACVNAPMVMVFKDTYEDLTPERLSEIIDAFDRGEGAEVPVGPQNGRFLSAPQAGFTTLIDEEAVLASVRERQDERRQAAVAAEPAVPPSYAAKPETHAPETNPAIKSPSPEKVAPAVEAAASAAPVPHDKAAADRAEPRVEGEGKERTRPIEPAADSADKAPELSSVTPIEGVEGAKPEGDKS